MYGPELRGPRIVLRPPRPEEIEPLSHLWSEPGVLRYQPGRLTTKTPDWWADWLRRSGESEDGVLWGIDLGGVLIGIISIRDIEWEDKHGTGGLAIAPAHWGQGYASESVALRSRYAFEQLGLEKLKTDTSDENAAIKRVLRKAGYRTVGIARRESFVNGRWQDGWIGELLREDWLRQHDPSKGT